MAISPHLYFWWCCIFQLFSCPPRDDLIINVAFFISLLDTVFSTLFFSCCHQTTPTVKVCRRVKSDAKTVKTLWTHQENGDFRFNRSKAGTIFFPYQNNSLFPDDQMPRLLLPSSLLHSFIIYRLSHEPRSESSKDKHVLWGSSKVQYSLNKQHLVWHCC